MIYFDLTKSDRHLDKNKLVQVQVTVQGKNGTFTRMQWKKASDVKPTDKVVGQPQQDNQNSPKKQEIKNERQFLLDLLNTQGRDNVFELAKKNGVTWNENPNPNINWMRCSMAAQKHIKQNPDVWGFTGGTDSQPDNKNKSDDSDDNVSENKPETPKNNSPKSKVDQAIKDKVKELGDKLGNDKLLEVAKKNGITWDENAHKGINIMRAKMAISQAIQADSSVYDKFIQDKTDSDIKDTQKDLKDTKNKVKELQDLIGQIQNPTAQQVAQQAQQTDILKGITTNTMSDYEKNHFGDIINTASPENLRNYRTLGMCAGDKESEQYLSNLYQRYSNAIQDINDTNSPNKYNPNVDNDPLRNKLQGVVNK